MDSRSPNTRKIRKDARGVFVLIGNTLYRPEVAVTRQTTMRSGAEVEEIWTWDGSGLPPLYPPVSQGSDHLADEIVQVDQIPTTNYALVGGETWAGHGSYDANDPELPEIRRRQGAPSEATEGVHSP